MITQLKALQDRREREGEEGFTLIELLIVIVVLGILAAVVIFALSGVTGTAKISACNADAKTVETAVAAYNADPPTTCTSLCTIGFEVTGTLAGDITPGTPSTYGTGTNAKALISNGDLNVWPGSANGYSISLAENVATYDNGVTVATVAPLYTPTEGAAVAGQVIVYTSGDVNGTIYDDQVTEPTVAGSIGCSNI
jgi:prepilin-type N-terminal cleavage/methylation domain-containing protein